MPESEHAAAGTGTLEVASNRFEDPDQAYRMLIEAHRGLSDDASADLNARLILILANQIGDAGILAQALELARKDLPQQPS